MRTVISRKDWDKVYYHSKHKFLQRKMKNEPLEAETTKVTESLKELVKIGLLPTDKYDREAFLGFRPIVHKQFFIYWTAINPPMEHLLYAISDILRPATIVGLGVFTGNPVVWSMGPALQGKYPATRLMGVEINKDHARIGQENFNKLKPPVPVAFLGEDAFETIKTIPDESIDLLYLDANGVDPTASARAGHNVSNKNINYSLLKAAYPKIKSKGYAICHNAYEKSFRREAADYLNFTDNPEFFAQTCTVGIDEMGIEMARKK